MPHTNRKKKPTSGKAPANPRKKFSRPKREYITSDDGWTQVASKGWKPVLNKGESCTGSQGPSLDMTLEEMSHEFGRYKMLWEGSDAYTKLKSLLSAIVDEDRRAIESAVCLGLGSLQALSLEWRRSSHIQLAALTTIGEALSLTSPIILQEPRFTDLDKSFLKSMGCVVVDDPEAFQHVHDDSFVYAIHCPIYLLWKVKERSCPALLVCNDLRNSWFKELKWPPAVPDQSGNEANPPEELLQGIAEQRKTDSKYYEETLSLIEDCEETAFPQLKYDFSDTMIYWRRSQNPKDSQDAVVMDN